ncbi:unnamed protein product [Arabidopsis halleri]
MSTNEIAKFCFVRVEPMIRASTHQRSPGSASLSDPVAHDPRFFLSCNYTFTLKQLFSFTL